MAQLGGTVQVLGGEEQGGRGAAPRAHHPQIEPLRICHQRAVVQTAVRTRRAKVAAQGRGLAAQRQGLEQVLVACCAVNAQQVALSAHRHRCGKGSVGALGVQHQNSAAAAGDHGGVGRAIDQGPQLGGDEELHLLQRVASARCALHIAGRHGVAQCGTADAAERNHIPFGKHTRHDQRADLGDAGACGTRQRQCVLRRQVDTAQRQAALADIEQVQRDAQGFCALAEDAAAQHQGRRLGGVHRDRARHLHLRCAQQRGLMVHQVQVHTQVIDLQFERIGQTQHQVHATDRAGHGQPLGVGVSGLAIEDGQAKLHIAHAQALGIGVDFAGFELAVAIGVRAVRAQTDKAAQARAAYAEHLGLHLAAIGQDHVLGAALQAHGACELEEVADVQVHRCADPHQLPGCTCHVQGDGLAGPRHHLEGVGAGREVNHLGVGIKIGSHATDQVDVHRQVVCRNRHIGHADKSHAGGHRFEGRPLQATGSSRYGAGQHQPKAHPIHHHADGVRARTIYARKGMQVLSTKAQRVDVECSAIGQRHCAGRLLKAQVAHHREEAIDLHIQVARGAHQRALAALEVQGFDCGAAIGQLGAGGDGHGHGRAVVHHRAVAAQVDFQLQTLGHNFHQGQAHFGGCGRSGRQAQPTARRACALCCRFLVQGNAQVQTGQLKARCRGVDRLVEQVAVVVGVEAVRTIQAHKRVELVATNDPAMRADRATRGDTDVFEAGGERKAAVHRQEVGRLHRHAGAVDLVLAEISGIEVHAQRVGVGPAVRGDGQRIGRRTRDHLKAQSRGVVAVEHRQELQQAAGVAKAEQARAFAKVALHAARLDQAVAARQARLQLRGQPDVQGAGAGQDQRARDLQPVILVVAFTAQLQGQALAVAYGLLAFDAHHTRCVQATKGACGVIAAAVHDAQATARRHHQVADGAQAIGHQQRRAGVGHQVHRHIGAQVHAARIGTDQALERQHRAGARVVHAQGNLASAGGAHLCIHAQAVAVDHQADGPAFAAVQTQAGADAGDREAAAVGQTHAAR